MTYAICFDFPEEDDPVFGWQKRGEPMGFTTNLANARTFASEKIAERVLLNSYGPAVRRHGVVVEVAA